MKKSLPLLLTVPIFITPPRKHCFAFIGLIITIFFVSCKKTDVFKESPTTPFISIEEKFFNSHRTNDAKENALVNFLKRKNEKEHFVEKVVKQIGYPRWDKALIHSRPSSKSDSTGNALGTYYIPFVRDSQNYVNASMVIKAHDNDTSVSYRCDWQYKRLQNSNKSIKDSAEYFAVFFMFMDKAVFGHNKFLITDKSLFRQGNNNPVYVTLNTISKNKNQSNLLALMDFCQDVSVAFNNCGNISLEKNIVPVACSGTVQYTYCWSEWVESGGGGGTGGTGGGSGGGGSGDNPLPPNCNGPVPLTGQGSAGNNLVEGCGGGWTPIENPSPQPPLTDPCDIAQNAAKKMDTLFSKINADTLSNALAGITDSLANEKGFNIYIQFSINESDVTDTTFAPPYCGKIIPGGAAGVDLPIDPTRHKLIAAPFHTHPRIGYAAHSAEDVYNTIQMEMEGLHFAGSFVAAADGSKYALNVTDYAQAAAFFNTKTLFLNGADWKVDSEIGKAFDKAYDHFILIYKSDLNKNNLAYEMAMSAVLNQYNTGVTLSKKDALGHFKPIIVKTIIDPKKPKKIKYIQDCL